MNHTHRLWPLAVAGLMLLIASSAAHGSLTLIGNASCNPSANLVTNGSFELGAPGPGNGYANQRQWGTGTTVMTYPFESPVGWTTAGPSQNYAVWGNDDPPNYRLRDSALLPDGAKAVYFGNAGATVNLAPIFNANGTVSFSGSPVITALFGAPVTLSQTIPTHLNPAPKYCLSFWVSGEFAFSGMLTEEGILGLQLTNVLAGNPVQYLTVPAGAGPQGAARFYQYEFVPLNSSLPVNITFYNWGHINMTPYGGVGTTELVLDHVIVNALPEPSTCVLGGIGILGLAVVQRRRQRSLGSAGRD